MNALPMPSPTTHQRNRHVSEVGYLLAVTLPPLILLLLFVFGSMRENGAEKLVEMQLTRLAAAGQPTDNHAMTVDFDRRLSTENSIAWHDVLAATRELNGRFNRFDPPVRFDERIEPVAPGDSWEFEPVVRRYIEQAQPILAALEELADDDRPVWEPLVLEGFSTLLPNLQESRDVTRLLVAEFWHAVHQHQPDRALRALELIDGVGHAFDWQMCAISDLIFFSHQSIQHELIRQSLEVGFWQDARHLERLRQQLADGEDLDARWRQMIASEQAMTLSEFRVGRSNPEFTDPPLNLYPFGISPATTANLVESMTKASAIGGAGTLAHVRRIEQEIDVVQRESSGTYTLNGIPFAYSDAPLGFLVQNYSSLSAAFVNQAMDRRWTITAVALKQYRLAEGHLPQELRELTWVGLAPADWMAIGDQPFGYRVEDDPEEAILWTVDPVELTASDIQVSAEPPSEISDDPEQVRRMEVRIR